MGGIAATTGFGRKWLMNFSFFLGGAGVCVPVPVVCAARRGRRRVDGGAW